MSTAAPSRLTSVGLPTAGSHVPPNAPTVTSIVDSDTRAPGGRSGAATAPIGPYSDAARQVAPV